MRIKTIIASALLLTCMNAHAFDQSVSATAMLEMCSSTDAESLPYVTCMSNINGYMNGLIHAKVLEEVKKNVFEEPEDDRLKLQEACLPKNTNNAELSQSFIKFVHENPGQGDRDFFSAFYDSMKKTYPCQ